ncbi:hypothetical protein INR49_025726 [Caranx melampygus]|nr:hypothetical protein INR49_025726 [Caranx melampygus]
MADEAFNVMRVKKKIVMTDPAEVSQMEQGSTVPPADSSDPGLNISTPSPTTELRRCTGSTSCPRS